MTGRMLPALPLRDVLDDEEVLARPDVAERPRLAREDSQRRRPPQPLLEPGLLQLQLPHGLELDRALRARVEVVVQRPVIEESDEHERSDREPAACHRSTDPPARPLLR